eukprot:87570_1
MKQSKSAHKAQHNEIEDSSTAETITVSTAYPSKNEGQYWRNKPTNQRVIGAEQTFTPQIKQVEKKEEKSFDFTVKLQRLITTDNKYIHWVQNIVKMPKFMTGWIVNIMKMHHHTT